MKSYPERAKSRSKYVSMMLIYTILLAVVFVNFPTAGITGQMILSGFGFGIIIGVMRETSMRMKYKKALKAGEV